MRRQQRPRNRNPDPRASNSRTIKNLPERNVSTRGRAFWLGWRRCARLFSALAEHKRECRSVELRALCNEVPRTPPGPEGSNGTGIRSEEHTSELQSHSDLVCRLLLEKKKKRDNPARLRYRKRSHSTPTS